MKKLLFPMLALFLMFGFNCIENRKITGSVRDDAGALPGVSIRTNHSKHFATSDAKGTFSIDVTTEDTELTFASIGFQSQTLKIKNKSKVNVVLSASNQSLQEVVVTGYGMQRKVASTASMEMIPAAPLQSSLQSRIPGVFVQKSKRRESIRKDMSQESYAAIQENAFHKSALEPLSTFSIDVDAASYSNIRRYINGGSLPPADAVRIEEMINYFDYHYDQPIGNDPVNIVTEMSVAPWNKDHKLVQIGLQAKTIPTLNLPASNLVFLIDVSGSMSDENKLPLLVSSFKMLTDQLRAKDKVAIVVYAGNSGVVLPATSGADKSKIKEALNRLSAGGSTAGGEGIELAYRIAAENFVKGGNNRVILATDGDFNVGANSDSEMQRLIEDKRKSGIFLTVLGYGMGNYKDSKMETLADKGNGNYAYIDNLTEARKVLVNEFGGTLFTIAKDVKLQIEFNPAKVQAYRLIGYENRMLNKEDFNDDKKDAGELGSGHTVTALYEIIPVGIKDRFTEKVDELKYQKPAAVKGNYTGEMMTVKLRYKDPNGSKSKLLVKPISDIALSLEQTQPNFRFAAAVAEFGMLLRQSSFKQNASFDQVISLAENAKGPDREGYRSEFISLVKSARLMQVDLLSLKNKRIMKEQN